MSTAHGYVQEAKRLTKQAQAEQDISINTIILRHLDIPVKTAKGVLKKIGYIEDRAFARSELVAVGNFALVKAAHAYGVAKAQADPDGFVGYAVRAVSRAMWAAVSDMQRGQVSIGKYGHELVPKILGIMAKYDDHTPEAAEIAKELGIAVHTVKKLMPIALGTKSLQDPGPGEAADEWTLGDSVADEAPTTEELAIEAINRQNVREALHQALAALPERVRVAVGLNTGFQAFEGTTVADVLFASRKANQQTARIRLRKMFQDGEADARRLGFEPQDATGMGTGSAGLPSPAPRGRARAQIKRDHPEDIWRRLTDRWRQEAANTG